MSLRGKRVLVTRALHQAAPLTAMLREGGAIPLSYPCLEVAPLDNCDELDAALGAAAAGNFDWLLFSSSNSARALAARMAQLDLELPGSKVALMGAASAMAARNLPGARLCAQVRAGDYAALPGALQLRPGAHVLLPQSDVAPSDTARGATAQRRPGDQRRGLAQRARQRRRGSGGTVARARGGRPALHQRLHPAQCDWPRRDCAVRAATRRCCARCPAPASEVRPPPPRRPVAFSASRWRGITVWRRCWTRWPGTGILGLLRGRN